MAEGELRTRDHDEIRRWAEEHGAQPATLPHTGHQRRVGVLRLDHSGYVGPDLVHVSWREWFDTFDRLGLTFTAGGRDPAGPGRVACTLVNPDGSAA